MLGFIPGGGESVAEGGINSLFLRSEIEQSREVPTIRKAGVRVTQLVEVAVL